VRPYYQSEKVTLYNADCREILPWLDPVDTCITDPPYGLSFMGKGWDHAVPGIDYWETVRHALLPGAHLLAFGGTRTWHRLAVAIEDSGLELRDTLMWLYGTGFPKGGNLGKMIDKRLGAERVITDPVVYAGGHVQNHSGVAAGTSYGGYENTGTTMQSLPSTDEAKAWEGYSSALKPAWEPIILARNPLDRTLVDTALTHGTGALNIEESRIGTETKVNQGRWPANVILDECTAEMLDEQGGSSRFFYTPKASKSERTMNGKVDNDHVTVKPLALMRYLSTLTKIPSNGIVLDPFAGSGSTLIAAVETGRHAIGIELDEHNCEIIAARLEAA